MNVIVSNRQKELIDNANIDAIKDLNGLFSVSDLINKFKNYFFSRMILDATSVVDFASRDVLSTLANEIGPEKLIILLPSSPEPPLEFKKLLIELKIYNFTNDINDVVKFIERPNTYEDAIKLIDDSFSNDVYVDNSIKEGEDNSNVSNTGMVNELNGQSSLGIILSSLNLNSVDASSNDVNPENEQENSNDAINDNSEVNDNNTNQENVASENNNEQEAKSSINYVETDHVLNMNNNDNLNTDNHVFLLNDNFDGTYNDVSQDKPKKLVLGFKNITTHAGCTSLVYMLHKMVEINLKKDVLSVEVNKNDFRLFRNNKMISANGDNLVDVINNAPENIIFVDLNEYNNLDICSQVLYLVEPSTIKLNELMATNRDIFKELKDKKVLLNKSLLSTNDIRTLESEAGMQFYYNLEPLNDRIMNDTIRRLLDLLGIN